MWVRPQPGCQYRHTITRALVPAEGFEASEHDLDVARGIACGDLILVEPAPTKPAKTGKTSEATA
jgi:hypothetical protein